MRGITIALVLGLATAALAITSVETRVLPVDAGLPEIVAETDPQTAEPQPVVPPQEIVAEIEAPKTAPATTEIVTPSSDAFPLLYQTILGLRPEWRPDACDRIFAEQGAKVVCERARDRGQRWAGQLSLWIYTEATRQKICAPSDPLCYVWFAGQAQRESGLSQGDICKVVLPVAWVEEAPADAELNTRVRMCWRRGSSAGRNCQKVYLRAHSEREYVVDRCAYDEVGLFQVRSHEARSGQIIPASGTPLPGPWAERRELLLEPWWNISLAFEAFRNGRDYCCGVGETADPVCLSRVDAWLFVYNTGKCKGTQGMRYIDKIGRSIVGAVKYVCRVIPDVDLGGFDVCDTEEVSDYFTPPGRPRRQRSAAAIR